eukprot:15005237-Alexandrium_andersonii.AAC.1
MVRGGPPAAKGGPNVSSHAPAMPACKSPTPKGRLGALQRPTGGAAAAAGPCPTVTTSWSGAN